MGEWGPYRYLYFVPRNGVKRLDGGKEKKKNSNLMIKSYA